MSKETSVKYPLSIPRHLYRQLQANAKRNVRSIAGEIILAVKLYLNAQEPVQAEEQKEPIK